MLFNTGLISEWKLTYYLIAFSAVWFAVDIWYTFMRVWGLRNKQDAYY